MSVQMRKGQQNAVTQPKSPGPWPSADRAVAMILFGERYSNERLYFVSRVMTLMLIALTISMIGNLAMFPNPPRYRYIPISNSGLVLPQVPLSQPNHDDQYVIDWTIDAVTRLHSFDFMNYRLQLQDAQKNMTAAGWESFQASMKQSNNFAAILGNSFVLTAVPTGAGKVIDKELVKGNYTWTIQFPMLISYRSSPPENAQRKTEGRVISDALNMTVTVSRVGVFLNHTGLGIKAMVGKR
ncbi:DotI/IcmL/TraM family protein [Rhizobium laguerreae]|nr:DotI/IcmL/TraM family protein [Rhizobium laguerreae]